MIDPEQRDGLYADSVRGILADAGFETPEVPDRIRYVAREPESDLEVTCTLDGSGLFSASASFEVDESAMTSDLTMVLLDSESGITSSSFRLNRSGNGRVLVTLSGFCRVRDRGNEDGRKKITACLLSLKRDVLAAMERLRDHI